MAKRLRRKDHKQEEEAVDLEITVSPPSVSDMTEQLTNFTADNYNIASGTNWSCTGWQRYPSPPARQVTTKITPSTDNSFTSFKYDPCSQGHKAKGFDLYEDGKLASNCVVCGSKIHLEEPPTNLIAVLVKRLIEDYLAGKLSNKKLSENVQLEENAATLAKIRLLRAMLEAEKEEIELARSRLSIIERDIMNALDENMVDL